jgi:tRNA(fMet)-specific endonuclease VapC
MYMLDTNTCIYAMQGAKKDKYAHVTGTFKEKIRHGLSISSITLAELEYGVAYSAQPEQNAVALLQFLAVFDIMPFEEIAASEYGKIRAGLKRKGLLIGPNDMLIAAHAKSLGYILVTSNRHAFERVIGLQLEDWMFS